MEKTALIVIDLQIGVQTETTPLYQLDRVLDGVNERIALFRKENHPIIFVQHHDQGLVFHSPEWALFPQLDFKRTDYFLDKTHANSFYHTHLQNLLQELDCRQLEICGAQTEYCVDTTIRMAHGLGYRLFMKRGLTTTVNNSLLGARTIIDHHEAIWADRFLSFL
ncbi:cysteine hydrolase family protein [Sporolactobacillus spathodeae]|uniref:Nicotinamidase-related amidase n=1 Tax=Sporolactobacillus spathodeae TaxID=1465502 RepID=A0ABS2Q893_9BACL|nr:cysteine hydrolase family protein [Sporolactobacillus spathodeae]MBM7657530.1 nicotinamidase-related amidase [Sporolactobacillus spathodeae]